MRRSAEIRFDVAQALALGRRDCQEDALAADFPMGAEMGFAVLADGMGGHAAGDVASRIVVTEVFSELKLRSAGLVSADLPGALRAAAEAANDCLRAHAERVPGCHGMGATLVAPVLVQSRLWWISVGDSLLLHWRDGRLARLNEDHSMAPQIDFMVRSGLMPAEEGATHPDRNCLTSVLSGADILRVDCPDEPMDLEEDDVLILASDGLQGLAEARIAAVVERHRGRPSAVIADALLHELDRLGDPDQDNVSVAVIRPERR
jgi:protein phosphatase